MAQSTPHWHDILAATVIFIPSFIGLMIYGIFIFVVINKKQLRSNSYYMLAVALGGPDCIMLCQLAFYSAPQTLGLEKFGEKFDVAMGVINNFAWFSSLAIIAEMALNRYICICKHAMQETIFSPKRTLFMIFAAFFYGFIMCIPSMNDCCYILYFPADYAWMYNLPAFGSTVTVNYRISFPS